VASLIDELAEVLDKENTEYEVMLTLSTDKTSAIVKNDIEQLQAILVKEQAQIDRINALEKKREETIKDICRVIKVDPRQLTVKVLIDLLSKKPEEQSKLIQVHTKLKKTLDRMVRANENNKALTRESMEILEFEMNLLKGLKMAPETNNYTKGAYSAGGTDTGVGAFDAKQ
jgi:ribosomal protein S6